MASTRFLRVVPTDGHGATRSGARIGEVVGDVVVVGEGRPGATGLPDVPPIALPTMAETLGFVAAEPAKPGTLYAAQASVPAVDPHDTRVRRRAAMDALAVADAAAAAAAARYGELRVGPTVVPPAPRGSLVLVLLRTVVGTGVLLAMVTVGLLAVASLDPGPLLVLPPAAALAAVVVVVRGERPRHRRPVVDDLVGAVAEVRAAELTACRARNRLMELGAHRRRFLTAVPGVISPPAP